MNQLIPSINFRTHDLLEQLSMTLSRARALAGVGASSDLADYDPDMINGYFDTIYMLIVEAQRFCHDIKNTCSSKA